MFLTRDKVYICHYQIVPAIWRLSGVSTFANLSSYQRFSLQYLGKFIQKYAQNLTLSFGAFS